MKTKTHPELREVLFKDVTTGDIFLIKSTITSNETMVWTNGKEYPSVKVEISSKSHPAYKGEGSWDNPKSGSRADSFSKKYNKTL